MITYEATFTYTDRHGAHIRADRRFTYPASITDQQQMVLLAEHIIGLTVCSRDLRITSVRRVGAVMQVDVV